MRTGVVLAHAVEALRLAGDRLEGAPTDPAGPGWASVGLVTALQAGCVLALSGYETADPGDIRPPRAGRVQDGAPPSPRLAPVTLLLRRASSPHYLDLPERLQLSRPAWRDLDHLVTTRNAVLHPGFANPLSHKVELAHPIHRACTILSHLILHHPAFDPGPHRNVILEAGRVLDRIASMCGDECDECC
jgi:hypothetical protein